MTKPLRKLTENTPKEEGLYWLKMLLIAFFIAKGVTLFIQPTLVSGNSMNGTLQHADYLLMNKVAYQGARSPDYGDIVVFNGGPNYLIKRVIGKPGDTVKIASGDVYVNDKKLVEAYINTSTSGDLEVVVTEGAYFVLGDNRDNSLDSRIFGPIPETHIVGQAFLRLLPIPDVLS